LELDISPVGSGSITLNGVIVESYPADSRFYGRISVTLEAIPAPGYYFTNWSGDLAGTENPVSLNIINDSLITADFSPIVHTISLQVDGNGSTDPAMGTHEYNEGDTVNTTAVPDKGWKFDGWSGDVTDPELTTTTFVVTSDKAITAGFSPIVHTISLDVDGNGSTDPAMGTHEYNEGDMVSITAVPDEGWRFESWSGDVADPESANTIVKMDSDRVITANFSQIVHPVTIAVNGGGSTTPMVGTHSFGEGTVVEITATPERGWRFESWSGDVADPESATTKVTIDSENAVTANFTRTAPSGWVIGAIIGGVTAAITIRLVARRRKASQNREEPGN